ncbi:hypothetical protein [Gemmobacter sp. 24YEA27]|uniref:hypothetical protein n=1 Tax=Gemmobacter sp. 24YEA27 TaxID=3040672 RepID=UPI0032C4AF71
MPLRPLATGDEISFPEPTGAPPLALKYHSETLESKHVETDPATGETRIIISGTTPLTEDLTHGLTTGSKIEEIWSIRDGDPASARVDITWDRSLGRGDWQTRSRVLTSLWGDAEDFHIVQRIQAWEARGWSLTAITRILCAGCKPLTIR